MNLRRRLSDECGVVMPLVAAASVALLAMTSLTVDVGRVANRNRDLQAIADVVAVDAAGALAGVSINELTATPRFVDAVKASAARNGFDDDPAVTPGRLDALTGFVAGGTPTDAWRLVADDGVQLDVAVGAGDIGVLPPGEALDLVGVWVRDRVDFAFGVGAVNASRTATAQADFAAGVGIGTRLLALGDATGNPTVLNLLLGKLLGIGVSAVSYEGLAGAGVTLSALAVNLDAGTVEQLLGLEVGVADFLLAVAEVLEQDGDLVRAALLNELLDIPIDPTLTVPVGELVKVGLGGAAAAASAELDVLGLVTAVAMIARGDNAVSLDGGVLLPGLLSVPVEVTVIEPPQVAFGPEGTTARTAQIKVELAPTVSLGAGPIRIAEAAVPVLVNVAEGAALISTIDCDPDPAARSVAVDPWIAGAEVDAAVGLSVEVDLPLLPPLLGLDVSLGLDTLVAENDPGPVAFSQDGSPAYGEIVQVGDDEIELLGADWDIEIGASLFGLDLLPSVLDDTVEALLQTVTDVVLLPVNALVAGVLTVLDGVLGLGLAEADVTATAPVCDAGRLIA